MEPLIEEEYEDWLKDEFIYWYKEMGLTGKETLEKMHKAGMTDFKLYHIYYLARKYKLDKRNKRKTS